VTSIDIETYLGEVHIGCILQYYQSLHSGSLAILEKGWIRGRKGGIFAVDVVGEVGVHVYRDTECHYL
jgi:hypothetical protein